MMYLVFTAITIVTAVQGCSLSTEEFDPRTPALTVSIAKHVLLGKVTSLLDVDPLARDVETAYGAVVDVLCSYKAGPLPGTITIGNAGFIPGLCDANELVADRKYVLFLSDPIINAKGTFYIQSLTAESPGNVTKYLDVCGLKMRYPLENGVPLVRDVCANVKQTGDCQIYNAKERETESISITQSPQRVKTTQNVRRRRYISLREDHLPRQIYLEQYKTKRAQ